jgi:hypothetical protein
MNDPTEAQIYAAAEAIWLIDAPRSGNEPLPFSEVDGWRKTAYFEKARGAIGAFLSMVDDVQPPA